MQDIKLLALLYTPFFWCVSIWSACGLLLVWYCLHCLSAVCVVLLKLFRVGSRWRLACCGCQLLPCLFEFVGCFWASGGLFVFGVGVCLSFCFCLSMVAESVGSVWNFGTLKTVCTQRVNLITYIDGGEMLIFLCATVSKTPVFLTFSLFCQNSISLSAIIYYLSDTCIFQGFSLWKIATFLTGFHVIKNRWNRNNDCFWPFRSVLVWHGKKPHTARPHG